MKTIKLGKTGMDVPVLALGCMRLADADRKQAAEYFRTALDLGLNFFDPRPTSTRAAARRRSSPISSARAASPATS